jgi:hypothetical protein
MPDMCAQYALDNKGHAPIYMDGVVIPRDMDSAVDTTGTNKRKYQVGRFRAVNN